MRYSSISCFFLFLFPMLAQAQFKGLITGKITDHQSQQSIEFANILLKSSKDSSVIANQVTNAKGIYRFTGVPEGSYYLQAGFVGYSNRRSSVFSIDNQRASAQINLSLDGGAKILTEVSINAKKAIYSNSLDRKVYHVDQDITAKSGSAAEVLQNVPLVQVDLDGNVSLRNAATTILINGKVSPLMGKNAAATLQQLPANSIERIEVITNPSAKYKPDGTGGIINIILKKNTKRGLNGSATVNGGNGKRYNANTTLNYNPGALNIFGSYSIRQDDRTRLTSNNRTQTNELSTVKSYYQDLITAQSRPFSNIANLGMDYNLDDHTTVGLSGSYYLRNMHKHDLTHKMIRSETGNQSYDRKRENFEQESQRNAAFYLEHSFSKEDHKLRLEFDIAHSPEVENNRYRNTFTLPAIAEQLDNTIIKQNSDQQHLSLAYENPLSGHSKLEAGYDGQFNKSDLDFFGEAYDPGQQQFLTDLQKTNRFIYQENVQALYGTFSYEYQKFSFMAGLRTEYADLNSRLITTSTTIPNHYFKLHPSLHLTYKLKENKQLQLNYSKRVRRPEADELNPFAEYADPTNVRVGNPLLLPEIIHSIETGYQWNNSIFSILPGIYYRYTQNRFTAVTQPLNDSVLVTRQQNLAADRAFGADLVFSANVSNRLMINLTGNVFYNEIDAANLGYSAKKSTISWSSNFNSSYSITNSSTLQLNSSYKSSRLSPQGKYLPSFVMNLGFRQEVLAKKASIYLTASDIFKSQRQVLSLQGPLLTQDIHTKSNSRIVYLGFSYNFGITKKKKDLQFDNSL
jgi:outer membrane receptor protein involved in Fe transport